MAQVNTSNEVSLCPTPGKRSATWGQNHSTQTTNIVDVPLGLRLLRDHRRNLFFGLPAPGRGQGFRPPTVNKR